MKTDNVAKKKKNGHKHRHPSERKRESGGPVGNEEEGRKEGRVLREGGLRREEAGGRVYEPRVRVVDESNVTYEYEGRKGEIVKGS